MPEKTPSFEDWVEYSMTKGYRIFKGEEAEDPQFERFDERTLIDYLGLLFEKPNDHMNRYSRDQAADATWFLFGVASGYISTVRNAQVPVELKVRCFRSVSTLYTEYFDRACTQDQDADLTNTDKLDLAVYMIWDMGGIAGAVMFPEQWPELLEPGFEILETVLRRCLTGACLKSALHGLGHIQAYHPDRVHALIDAFLARRKGLAPWLREYAEQARSGMVQ